MRGLLNFDGPLMSGLTKVMTLIMINSVWVILCLPVITAGPATTAFYYTIQKNIKYNRGYAFQCFWDSFKENFRQSFLAGLLIISLMAVLFMDYGALKVLTANGVVPEGFEAILYIMGAMVLVYAMWLFAYIARFENTMGMLFKNAVILTVANLPYSFLIFILGALAALIIWLVPPALLIMPAVAIWFASIFMEKAFFKNMTEEDRRLEAERNDDYREL